MKKYFFAIIIYLLSCAPTESVVTHDDVKVLQEFINNSYETLDMGTDDNENGIIEHVFEKVKTGSHAKDVMDVLE